MKKLTFVLFFCFGLLTCGYSQTKQESIKELFQLMKQDSAIMKTFDSLIPMIAQKENQPMDSVAKEKAEGSMMMFRGMVKVIISMVNEDKIKLYDRYYTQDEINQLIAFYKSPIGRKYVTTSPEITKDIVMKILKDLPDLKKKMNPKPEEQQGSTK